MLASDKHRVRALAIKKRLREIEAVDDLTDEIRSESTGLQSELVDVETREAAALASEPDPDERIVSEDSEVRERREVRGRTGFRDYLVAACGGAPVAGAAAEFNAACGVAAGDHVPRELFDGPARELRQVRQAEEHRAVTPGPSIDAPAMPTIPYLFEMAVISTLGLEYPTVESGLQQIPSITTAPPVERGSGGRRGAVNGGRLRAREPQPEAAHGSNRIQRRGSGRASGA